MQKLIRIPFATALIETFRQGYSFKNLGSDLLAGITVGIIALPLAMALAIASGVAPQYGLYTAIIAGIVIAISGGSRFSVSGPTAAFVVLLFPITAQYGLGGLLMATFMAGIILVLMGWFRLGKFIQFVPAPVTLGFTAGIAVVIASLQLKDFFGMSDLDNSLHFFEKILHFFQNLSAISFGDVFIGLITLLVLIFWPRLNLKIPGHLPALLVGIGFAFGASFLIDGFEIVYLGDLFTWQIGDETGKGIPPIAPEFILPWLMPNAEGEPIGFSWQLFNALLPSALTLALLASIESLLCAMVSDSLTKTRHDPNAEMVGQGLGNIIAPFFGGITATAALARTATNIRAGAFSPLSAIFHSVTVLICILVFAEWLSWLPMAGMAALLLMVAWNMSEAGRFMQILKIAPRSDVVVLLTCFSLTIVFDMVVAVTVGVVLAAFLFMIHMAEITHMRISTDEEKKELDLPESVAYFNIAGALFFGAAEKTLGYLGRINEDIDSVFINMSQVSSLDVTGLDTLATSLRPLKSEGKMIFLIGLETRLQHKILKTGLADELELKFDRTPYHAVRHWKKLRSRQAMEELEAKQAETEASPNN